MEKSHNWTEYVGRVDEDGIVANADGLVGYVVFGVLPKIKQKIDNYNENGRIDFGRDFEI